jgi:hypothetical protein
MGGEWNIFMFRAPNVVAPVCVNWGPVVWTRWTRLIIYWHIRDLWGPVNLVALTIAALNVTLPSFTDVHWDSVRVTHRLLVEVFTRKMTLGWGRTRPDSLIVIVKGGHLYCLCGSRVSCLSGYFPCKVYIDSKLHDTFEYVWCVFAAVIP